VRKDAAAEAAKADTEPLVARRRAKLGYKEARELEALPAMLEALEREQSGITQRLADPATYNDRTVDVKALNARHDAIEAELTNLLARWEELENK
jgi:ATP-binding cassette subfamily F protein uup